MVNNLTAYDIRKKNFLNVITLVKEIKTISVSVTKTSCAQKCAHCNGRHLKSMKDITFLDNCDFDRFDSFLISGGCDENGSVPIVDFKEKLALLPDHVKINCHSGIITTEEAEILSHFVDKISFDFICDDLIINDIYKLNRSYQDYIDSYIAIANFIDVAPHFCIGLTNPGDEDSSYEIRSLDILSTLIKSKAVPCPKEIVFIIFSPTKGTEMENCLPPPISRVENVLSYARLLFPDIHLNLGCMRPFGEYRAKVDKVAVDCGINLIVLPHKSLDTYISDMGISVVEENKCCVLANTRSEY